MSTILGVIAPIVVGLLYITLVSFVDEPARQKLNAVIVGGAGATYISGGSLGIWELAFTALMTFCAYRGLRDYRWIGAAWLLHTAWDIVHHLRGAPIIPSLAHSSYGCAICDPVLALWMFRGAPPIWTWFRRRGPLDTSSRPAIHVTH